MSTAVKILQKFRERAPEEYKAQANINNALRDGKLTKPDRCQKCGKSGKLEAHHPNYAKPNAVTWLCRSCHLQIPQKGTK